MALAPILVRVQALLDQRQVVEAAATLSTAADAGDPAALMELAQWRIIGSILPRDLSTARLLLDRASRAGHVDASLLLASFLAAEVGGPADWPRALSLVESLCDRSDAARAQLAMISRMALDAAGRPVSLASIDPVRERPWIARCPSFLSVDECDYLAQLGRPLLQPSVVVDPASGRMVPNPVRRSQGMMFGVHTEDLVVNAINRRIAALSDTLFEQGEPLQLLQYGRGEEYRPHLDTLPNEPNQRTTTVIVYLSDAYQGGETLFPRLGLDIRGTKGEALVFRNVDDQGKPEPLSLHAGAPVIQGTKTICTRWIRERRFVFPPPRALLSQAP
jgi:prolyl 4-hydroxylase